MSHPIRVIRDLLEGVLGLVYPLTCPLCGRVLGSPHPTGFCEECPRRLHLIEGLVCPGCGLPPSDRPGFRVEHRFCPQCRRRPFKGLTLVRSVSLFVGESRRLVHAMKYEEKPWLAVSLGRMMADRLSLWTEIPKPDCVIPVPLHDRRRRERGYNQADLIARELSCRLRRPLMSNALTRTRETRSQMELTARDRETNVKGAFLCLPQLDGAVVLLVDDVATTCSTLESCALSLKAKGASIVVGYTWARQPVEVEKTASLTIT